MPPELLLATRERTKPRNAFENFGDFFWELLSKIAGPLVKNILTTLRITAAVSVVDARIQKKNQKQNKTWFLRILVIFGDMPLIKCEVSLTLI